jgi:hypothetical protein
VAAITCTPNQTKQIGASFCAAMHVVTKIAGSRDETNTYLDINFLLQINRIYNLLYKFVFLFLVMYNSDTNVDSDFFSTLFLF